jgi:hypothetical protein
MSGNKKSKFNLDEIIQGLDLKFEPSDKIYKDNNKPMRKRQSKPQKQPRAPKSVQTKHSASKKLTKDELKKLCDEKGIPYANGWKLDKLQRCVKDSIYDIDDLDRKTLRNLCKEQGIKYYDSWNREKLDKICRAGKSSSRKSPPSSPKRKSPPSSPKRKSPPSSPKRKTSKSESVETQKQFMKRIIDSLSKMEEEIRRCSETEKRFSRQQEEIKGLKKRLGIIEKMKETFTVPVEVNGKNIDLDIINPNGTGSLDSPTRIVIPEASSSSVSSSSVSESSSDASLILGEGHNILMSNKPGPSSEVGVANAVSSLTNILNKFNEMSEIGQREPEYISENDGLADMASIIGSDVDAESDSEEESDEKDFDLIYKDAFRKRQEDYDKFRRDCTNIKKQKTCKATTDATHPPKGCVWKKVDNKYKCTPSTRSKKQPVNKKSKPEKGKEELDQSVDQSMIDELKNLLDIKTKCSNIVEKPKCLNTTNNSHPPFGCLWKNKSCAPRKNKKSDKNKKSVKKANEESVIKGDNIYPDMTIGTAPVFIKNFFHLFGHNEYTVVKKVKNKDKVELNFRKISPKLLNADGSKLVYPHISKNKKIANKRFTKMVWFIHVDDYINKDGNSEVQIHVSENGSVFIPNTLTLEQLDYALHYISYMFSEEFDISSIDSNLIESNAEFSQITGHFHVDYPIRLTEFMDAINNMYSRKQNKVIATYEPEISGPGLIILIEDILGELGMKTKKERKKSKKVVDPRIIVWVTGKMKITGVNNRKDLKIARKYIIDLLNELLIKYPGINKKNRNVTQKEFQKIEQEKFGKITNKIMQEYNHNLEQLAIDALYNESPEANLFETEFTKEDIKRKMKELEESINDIDLIDPIQIAELGDPNIFNPEIVLGNESYSEESLSSLSDPTDEHILDEEASKAANLLFGDMDF